MCSYARGNQKLMLGVTPQVSSVCLFLRQGLTLNLDLDNCGRLADKSQRSPCLHPSSTRITSMHHCTWLSTWCWESKLGPPAYTVSWAISQPAWFLRSNLILQPKLALNLLHNQDCLQTHQDPPALAFLSVALKMCTLIDCFYCLKSNSFWKALWPEFTGNKHLF